MPERSADLRFDLLKNEWQQEFLHLRALTSTEILELNSHAIFPDHARNAALGAHGRFPTCELQTDVHRRALSKHAGTPHQQSANAHIHRAALHFLAARLDQHFTANRNTMKAAPFVLDLAPRGADDPQH